MEAERALVVKLAALVVAWIAAAYVFRDGLGLLVFVALGVATLAHLLRVVFLGKKRRTLGDLWSALKDAFWGIG